MILEAIISRRSISQAGKVEIRSTNKQTAKMGFAKSAPVPATVFYTFGYESIQFIYLDHRISK